MSVYQDIIVGVKDNKRLLAVLIDPDKMEIADLPAFLSKLNASSITYIFVGGSTVKDHVTEVLVQELKKHTSMKIVLFPGDISQIAPSADALLFLSLISGRNPEYLIGKHVKSVPNIKASNLEVISTGYVLIENGKESAVERVTQTTPISREDIDLICDTAKAGELLGMKLMYLEAGSGAKDSVPYEVVRRVKKDLSIPLIVGGGIRDQQQIDKLFESGADLIVIGTAIENDESFINMIK